VTETEIEIGTEIGIEIGIGIGIETGIEIEIGTETEIEGIEIGMRTVVAIGEYYGVHLNTN